MLNTDVLVACLLLLTNINTTPNTLSSLEVCALLSRNLISRHFSQPSSYDGFFLASGRKNTETASVVPYWCLWRGIACLGLSPFRTLLFEETGFHNRVPLRDILADLIAEATFIVVAGW